MRLHSPRTMRSALLAIAVVASLALAGCGGGGTTSKTGYVKKNEALFKSLPSYPSAKVHARDDERVQLELEQLARLPD